jgi:hypothetical protein
MKLISHRGNLRGPVKSKENRPSYIDSAIGLGFDVEIDVRYCNNSFWLGHDTSDYKIDINWLEKRREKLWIHCKDLKSTTELLKLSNNLNIFCHSSDMYVLTSSNYVWVHNLKDTINEKCIIPLLSLEEIKENTHLKPFGVCTDYIFDCSKIFNINEKY